MPGGEWMNLVLPDPALRGCKKATQRLGFRRFGRRPLRLERAEGLV